MSTLRQKLSKLLEQIDNRSYPGPELEDMLRLQDRIAKDIGSDDATEAMALLGYLLKNKYVKIEPKSGIVLNPDKSEDIQLLLNMK